MDLLQAIILGIIQGLTEFLPVSSSGHLILVPWAADWRFFMAHPDLNKTFDVALHLGTFLALLAAFWRDVVRLVIALLHSLARRRATTPYERLAWLLVVSTVPAGIIGVALENFIVEQLGRPWLIAILMIAFGLVMWFIDANAPKDRSIETLRWTDALWIGLAQALALAPGVSRSGVTMITGRALSLNRESAARYSFLMSIPIIGGAAAYKGLEVLQTGLPARMTKPFIWGTVAAAVAGLVAVWSLLAYVRRHDFRPFVFYRLAIGAAVLVTIALGLRGATGL